MRETGGNGRLEKVNISYDERSYLNFIAEQPMLQ